MSATSGYAKKIESLIQQRDALHTRREIMTTYRVTFEVTPPVDATEDQVEEWVRYCLGELGGIENENPLSDYDLEAKSVYVS